MLKQIKQTCQGFKQTQRIKRMFPEWFFALKTVNYGESKYNIIYNPKNNKPPLIGVYLRKPGLKQWLKQKLNGLMCIIINRNGGKWRKEKNRN